MGPLKAPSIRYDIKCFGPNGLEKWRECVPNAVVTQGKNDLVDKYFKGSAYTASFFMLLKGVGTIAASDTIASHPGWLEVNPYAGNRKPMVWGSTVNGSNTANTVSYDVTSSATVAGAGLATVASGTSGILYSVSNFSSPRIVTEGDTINVIATVSVV